MEFNVENGDDRQTILLVDDNPKDLVLLEAGLRTAGITAPVYMARDGAEAIAYMEGVGKYADRLRFPVPTVVITDLAMPNEGGLKVLEWMRAQPISGLLPVAILTGAARLEVIEKAYSLGAASCLLKTDDFAALCLKLKRFWSDHVACKQRSNESAGPSPVSAFAA